MTTHKVKGRFLSGANPVTNKKLQMIPKNIYLKRRTNQLLNNFILLNLE